VECADLSALWKTATCRSYLSSSKSAGQSGDKSQHSKFAIPARLYFWPLPSYFCLMPKCPTCGKPVEWQDNSYRPFCSERCKLIDFSRWANEEYRVPGKMINPEATEQNDPNQASENEEANGE
jgi:endogenous inhibitor of DNA gyrase (YacG/DUF329 family)